MNTDNQNCDKYYYTRTAIPYNKYVLLNEVLTYLQSIEPKTISPEIHTDYCLSRQFLRNAIADMRHDLIIDADDRAFISVRMWREYALMRRAVNILKNNVESAHACEALMHGLEAAAYAVADSPDFAPACQVALTFARKAVAEKEKANV